MGRIIIFVRYVTLPHKKKNWKNGRINKYDREKNQNFWAK
jgi:hypothetical protein